MARSRWCRLGSEDLESDDGLNHIFRIFKSIVLLGQSAIFDVLFEDDNIVSFFGTLERDPERKTKSNFRDFIEHTARFKEVRKNGLSPCGPPPVPCSPASTAAFAWPAFVWAACARAAFVWAA